jgi:hypothetical protein
MRPSASAKLGASYAFSEEALAFSGGSMGGARALSMATIDVLEGTPRDLRWPRTEPEREMGGMTSQMPRAPETAR